MKYLVFLLSLTTFVSAEEMAIVLENENGDVILCKSATFHYDSKPELLVLKVDNQCFSATMSEYQCTNKDGQYSEEDLLFIANTAMSNQLCEGTDIYISNAVLDNTEINASNSIRFGKNVIIGPDVKFSHK